MELNYTQGLHYAENVDDIKIENDELSMKIEESYDNKVKLQLDSINETFNCPPLEEKRSIQLNYINDSISYENIKQEYEEWSIENAKDSDIGIKTEIGEQFDKTDQTMRIKEPDHSEKPNSTDANNCDFSGLQSFQCNVCDSDTSNGKKNEKLSNIERTACVLCNKKMPTNNFSNHHIKHVHNESLTLLQRNISAKLKAHIDFVHPEFRKFQCHLCDFRSTRKCKLKFHIERVHLKLRTYQCNLCAYKAPTKSVLKKHIDGFHLKLKNHQCHSCDYKSTQKSDLKRHIETVHLKSKHHQCHLCDHKTNTKSGLKRHIDGLHLKLKKYQCDSCDYKTSFRGNLKKHIVSVHLKLKNHQCNFCDYKATIKGHLISHIEDIHLNLKKYECYLCGHKATRKSNLKSHIERVHLNLKK